MSANGRVGVKNGFTVYTLESHRVKLAVVPELGGRILSLKNARTRREWMWRPPGRLRLFRNRLGDDFSRSTLTGADECLPTIGRCRWEGRYLPDHGEVWSARWKIDAEEWKRGALKMSVALKVSPFVFGRTIKVRENQVLIDYELQNIGRRAEHFLWALHPLLAVRAGDRLMLPKSSRLLMSGKAWREDLAEAIPNGGAEKLFVAPLREGCAGIHNPRTGDRLDFEWCPVKNSALGLWLTRGGWNGHHHLALEPTNGDDDSLSAAAKRKRCGKLGAGETVTWQVVIHVGP